MTTSSQSARKRPVRSYVIRSGRLTDSQRKAIDAHWTKHVIGFSDSVIDWDEVFAELRPLTVEIGFGMGASLLEMARSDPDSNFLGIEVHRPGVGRVLHEIENHGLQNLKLMCHDATEVLSHCFAEQSIDRLLLLFPDPWPKKRHQKRRIVQPGTVELLASRLKPGATFHLATDWRNYAEQMLAVLQDCDSLQNQIGRDQYWSTPERPATKFEQRGRRLGHEVWDLLFIKRS